MKVELNGFLEYVSAGNGWEDSIRLCDEGAPRTMGGMPLVIDELKKFHGKEIKLTVELLHPAADPAAPKPPAAER